MEARSRRRSLRVIAVAVGGGLLVVGAIAAVAEGPRTRSVEQASDATDDTDAGMASSSPAATAAPTIAAGVTTVATAGPTSDAAVATTASVTSAATVTAAVPSSSGGLLALDLLGFITVQNEQQAGYSRDRFGYPADPDGDACDTRAEVLMSESSSLPQVAQPGCTVIAGDWLSLYDGVVYSDAAELEIDHVVALKEAWDSGAWAWDGAALVAYGNDLTDPRTLRAVSASTNRSKGDKDPSNWIPDSGVCEFLADWVSVKVRWGLTMDQSEFGRIRNLLQGDCAGTTTAPFTPVSIGLAAPPSAPPTAPPAAPVTAPQQFDPATPAPTTPAAADVYYKNCDAARAAGAAPILRGEPGYRPALDRDDDGVACES